MGPEREKPEDNRKDKASPAPRPPLEAAVPAPMEHR